MCAIVTFLSALLSFLSRVCAFLSQKVVVGADALTRWVDWSDRNVCILFGDGAGAVVLQVRMWELHRRKRIKNKHKDYQLNHKRMSGVCA